METGFIGWDGLIFLNGLGSSFAYCMIGAKDLNRGGLKKPSPKILLLKKGSRQSTEEMSQLPMRDEALFPLSDVAFGFFHERLAFGAIHSSAAGADHADALANDCESRSAIGATRRLTTALASSVAVVGAIQIIRSGDDRRQGAILRAKIAGSKYACRNGRAGSETIAETRVTLTARKLLAKGHGHHLKLNWKCVNGWDGVGFSSVCLAAALQIAKAAPGLPGTAKSRKPPSRAASGDSARGA